MVTSQKTKKNPKKTSSLTKNTKTSSASAIVEKRNTSWDSESTVSVITKTTGPKVVIQSEDVGDVTHSYNQKQKDSLLKFICMIVMCAIILITFFLSLKTYNMVSELAHYL